MHTIENTLFVGKVWQHFERIGSTNALAVEEVSKNNPSEGTVISADFQTQGRGQLDSKWSSAAGENLTFSLILYPKFLLARDQFQLNQAVSLALCDCMTRYLNASVKVKWPNDIYIGKRKIAGILIQNQLSGAFIQSSVIGIGLNIQQTNFPPDIQPAPTSMALEQEGQTFERQEIAATLCQHLEQRYLQLRSGQTDQLHRDYLHHLYQFMEDALYAYPEGEVFSGRIVGLSPTGKLLIDHQKGQEAFALKEVKFL